MYMADGDLFCQKSQGMANGGGMEGTVDFLYFAMGTTVPRRGEIQEAGVGTATKQLVLN